jgi:hypothetical protein
VPDVSGFWKMNASMYVNKTREIPRISEEKTSPERKTGRGSRNRSPFQSLSKSQFTEERLPGIPVL